MEDLHIVQGARCSDAEPFTEVLLPHRTDDIFWEAACREIPLSPSRVVHPVTKSQHREFKQVESTL